MADPRKKPTPIAAAAPLYVYTEALMRAGGVARTGITRWVQMGLLPEPELEMCQDPRWKSRFVQNRYPAWAEERARFIGKKRKEGFGLAEIAEMLRELDDAEPASSREPPGVTASEVEKVADVSSGTLAIWVRRGLLPAPTRVSQGYPNGFFNRYPSRALELARFIREKRDDGLSLDEIAELIRSFGASGRRSR